jgi:hypothetical protein
MRWSIAVGCCALLMTGIGVAGATTYHVNLDGSGDFTTILAAVEGAQSGDVILLGNGVFTGPGNCNVWCPDAAIMIRSASGDPDLCRIDCEGAAVALRFDLSAGVQTVIEDITMEHGSSISLGGAVATSGAGSTRFIRCAFVDNHAQYQGGAVCGGVSSIMTFDRCRFVGNTAQTGGAVSCVGSTAEFYQCVFLDNTATADGGGGSIVTNGGWADYWQCIFSGNVAVAGGGVACGGASMALSECTFTGNEASLHGSALIAQSGSATVENCLVAYNPGESSVVCGLSGTIDIACCDIYGNGADWVDCIASQLGVNGNICEDPLFCSASPHDDENWAISGDSPCTVFHSGCGQIGAAGVGCGPTPAESRTWGGVKHLFLK